MDYRIFGRTGWATSEVGLGTWNIGNRWGELSDSKAEQIVRSAFDAGINLFDTADMYGNPHGTSEMRLGRAITGFRHQVYITSKVGHWGEYTGKEVSMTTPDLVRLCGHASLGRLGTDYIDLLLCHEGNIEDPRTYIEGFEQLKAEGSIQEYGISTNDFDVLKTFYEESDGACAAVEVEYSLLNRSAEENILPFCEENDLGVLVRGPLARGLLTGKFDENTEFTDSVRKSWNEGGSNRQEFLDKLSQVDRLTESLQQDENMTTTALEYVASHPIGPVVIPGATTPRQAVQNASISSREMEEKRRTQLRI